MQTAKKKTYRKFLLNVVIILNVLALSLALFSYQKGATETKAWYNAGWMYRKSVTVSNPSATVSNADVLVTIDTASLISAGKLQSDCDDLRFLDSDDSTALSYWIESSCNTSNTQVWVRIPSLPSGGKTIYMYYGNPSAAKGQMAWSGNFILMSSTSCASGWTRNTSFDSRFPYGSSSYGTTGGSSSHGHGTFSKTTGGATNGYGCSDQDCGSTSLNQLSHTHTFSGTVASSTIWPPYTNTYFCSKSSLDIISGQIALYDSLPASNWTRNTAFDSRMPRGASSYGSTGGSTTHNHSLSGLSSSLGGAGKMYDYANCIGRAAYASRGDHAHIDFTGSSVGTADNTPPYRNMIFGQANSNMVGLASMITMATAQPPLGWNRYTNLDGRIPRGYSSSGSTGGTTTHTHSVTVTSPNVNVGGNNNPEPGGSNVTHYAHGHTVTFTSASANHEPPRLTTLFIQRKSSVSTSLSGTEEMYNQAPTAPTELLTEDITTLIPRFSAVYNDPDAGDWALSYQIQVNTASDFTGTVMWDSGKIDGIAITSGDRSQQFQYNGTALTLDGSIYYWRIKFWDLLGAEGSWSSTSQFKMNRSPNAPTSLLTEGEESPTNVLDITPEFTAICSDPDGDSCTHYEIEVNTASDFTGDVMWDSGQQAFATPVTNNEQTPDIAYAGSELSTTGTYIYNWRIRVWDSDGAVSDWSTVSNFKMAIPPYAPQGLTLNQETMPSQVTEILTFSAIHKDFNQSNGIYYQIQLSRDKGFTDLVWDSGKTAIEPVASDTRTPEIPYTGDQLPLDGSTNYWRMKFWDEDDLEGEWTDSQTFTMLDKPSTLTNISGEALTTSTIRWSFTETSDNELGVKIYDENDTLVKTCIGENLTYCDETGLEENTQYTRKLTIYNSEAESDMSESASRYTLVSTPTSPTEVLKTTDSISVTTEQLPNFPEYYFDCQENCTEGVGSWTQSLTAEVTNLNSNTPYSFKVKARNGDGIETEYSNTSTIYTLSEVPTLSAGPLSETSISLNASNINNIASGQSGLYFECTDENCNDGLQEWIKNTSDIVIGLQPNTQYFFRVKARNYDGIETDWTNTVVATHADVPSISQVTVEDFDTLNVTLNMENNPQTTMVLIQESTTGKYVNPSTNLLQTDPIWDKYSNITQPLAVDGLTSGTTYSFKVKAKNLANIETEFSETVSATTKLSNITALTPTVNSSTEITWNIDEYTDSILGIKLFNSDGELLKTCTGTDIHSCTETDLSPNTQYSRKLIIYNDIAESNFSNTVSATTFANTPSLEEITNITNTSVTTNILSNGNPESTEYLLMEENTGKYVNTNSHLLQTDPIWTAYSDIVQPISINGLTSGTTYIFKVKARNSAEIETEYSSTVSATTLLTDITALTPTVDSNSQITWRIAEHSENILGIKIYDENSTLIKTCTGSAITSCSENGLSPNTQYSRKLTIYNSEIESSFTELVTATTFAQLPKFEIKNVQITETTIAVNPNGNPDHTEYLLMEEDSGKYVSPQTGLLQSTATYARYEDWGGVEGVTIRELQANTPYRFLVRARNSEGIETEWIASDIYTHAYTPSITGIDVIDSDTVSISIENGENPSITPIAIQETTTGKYLNIDTNLLESTLQWFSFGDIQQPIDLNNLNSGTTYSFKVKAKNLANIETEFSDTVSATTKLSSITALTPTVNSSTEITWNIDEYTDSILGIKLFNSDGELLKTCTGTDIHSCTETDLSPNTQYSRKLIIYNDTAESNFSNTVSATTFANTPSLENIEEGKYTYNSVTLNITTNSNPDTTDYLIVEESTGKYVNPETELLQSTPYYATYEEFGAQNGITIYGLQPNSTYSFNIKARNSELIETENSDTRSVATLAQQPSLVSVTAIDTTTLRVIIDAASNPSSTNLMLQEKKSGRYIDPSDGTMKNTASWKAVSQWGGVNGILVKNLSPNTQYSFCTTAKNAIDIATECSQELTAYTLAQTPTITARVTGSSSVELVVDQDGNPNGTQFQVIDTRSGGYIDSNGRFTSSASNIKPDSTISTIQITSLPPNTSYIFRVRSRNLDGVNSNWSSTVPVTTWANTPSNLLFNTVAGSSGKISFSSNGNPNNTQYAIQEVSTGKYVDYSTNTLTDSIVWGTYASWRTTTGITIRNLEPGKTYSFRVKARNSENVETPYIDGNTGKTYSVIVNKQENLKVGLANNLSVDVSTSEGAQTGVQKVRVMREEYLIADLLISFETNRDWSNAIFESDPQNSKAVVKVDNTHGITDKFTMYVVSGDTNAFRICPQASSLEAVSSTCANSVLYMGEFPQTKEVEGTSVTVSKAQIEGITYWIADGLTGTGGLGEVIEDESTSTGGSFNIPEVTQKLVKQVNQAVEGAISKTIDGLDQTSLGQLEKEELTTIAATTTVVTVSVATTTTLGGISQLGYAFAQVIVNILNTLGFRRKRHPSGYVYNAVTRAPIKQAIVRIFTPDHKLVESAVTDSSGVFWSTLEEGTYMFEVKKRGFSFPSQLIVGREDYPLTDIYHGDITLVKKDGVKVVIPIDPKKATTQSKFITLLRSIFSVLIPILNIALFVIGITITIYMYVKYPTTANMLLGLLYIPATVLLVKSIFNISSSYGKIVYEDRTAASGITILLKEKEFGKVVEKRVTDENGRYFFDIKERGEYELEIFNKDISLVKGKTSILSKGNTKVVSKLVVRKI